MNAISLALIILTVIGTPIPAIAVEEELAQRCPAQNVEWVDGGNVCHGGASALAVSVKSIPVDSRAQLGEVAVVDDDTKPGAAAEGDNGDTWVGNPLEAVEPPPAPCNPLSEQVCGVPPGCRPQSSWVKMCAMNPPVTYVNTCAAEGAGAVLLHWGPCTRDDGSFIQEAR